MFVIYKKLTSPDASPVLGPSSPNMKPTDISASSSSSSSNSNISSNSSSNSSSSNSSSIIEPFSLYNCCCSPRNHASKSTAPEQGQEQGQGQDMPHPDGKCHQCPVESKYAFGHATHYTYIATTSRLLCEFETGTP